MMTEEVRQVLLLSSYCGGENAGCTDENPCADCLAMCNVFEVPALGKYLREFGAPAHPVEPDHQVADFKPCSGCPEIATCARGKTCGHYSADDDGTDEAPAHPAEVERPVIEIRPVFKDGAPILYDMYFRGAWLGSRRLLRQCADDLDAALS